MVTSLIALVILVMFLPLWVIKVAIALRGVIEMLSEPWVPKESVRKQSVKASG